MPHTTIADATTAAGLMMILLIFRYDAVHFAIRLRRSSRLPPIIAIDDFFTLFADMPAACRRHLLPATPCRALSAPYFFSVHFAFIFTFI